MSKTLNGKELADKIKKDLAEKISKLDRKPGLAAVLIGNDKASEIYINLKERACHEVGINFHKYLCNEKCYGNISEEEVLELINFLNRDKNTHGIIIQLPLPKKFNTQKIINAVDPEKYVDGFHPKNKNKKIIPPTIAGIIELLKSTNEELKNKKTLIIGKGDVFISGLEKYQGTGNKRHKNHQKYPYQL